MRIHKLILVKLIFISSIFSSTFSSQKNDFEDFFAESVESRDLVTLKDHNAALVSADYTTRPNAHLFPSPGECGPLMLVEKIKGGKEALLKEFPWLVTLEYRVHRNGLASACSGSIINPKYVLTAAHCVRGEVEKIGPLVSFRVGVHYSRTQSRYCHEYDSNGKEGGVICIPAPVRHNIVEKIVHENYEVQSHRPSHDIALLRTDQDIRYSPSVAPVCLPSVMPNLRPLQEGDRLTVAGWGQTSQHGPFSAYKLKVEVPYVSNENCLQPVNDGQLCAGGTLGKDSCRGDSGSSLAHISASGWVLEGIVSFGPPCGLPTPAIYTRVRNFADWIYDNVKP